MSNGAAIITSDVEQQLVHIDLLQLLLYGRAVVGAHDRLLLVQLASDGDEFHRRLVLVRDELDGAASALLHEYLGDVYFVIRVGEVGMLECFGRSDPELRLFLQHLPQQIDLYLSENVPFWLSLSN